MSGVRVRRHVRRATGRRYTFRHNPAAMTGLTLQEAIDEVRAGHMGGYTWTLGFKFDVDDAAGMRRVYDKIGDRTMYVVATTHRTLEEWERPGELSVRIGHNEGVGLWRDPATGRVFFGPKVSEEWALRFAREHGQESILKVDGRGRSFEFLEVR